MVLKPRSGRRLSKFHEFKFVERIIDVFPRFIEAFKDPKTWLFFFFAGIANLQGGVGVQYSIILKGFGFSTVQAALLNFPVGFAVSSPTVIIL